MCGGEVLVDVIDDDECYYYCVVTCDANADRLDVMPTRCLGGSRGWEALELRAWEVRELSMTRICCVR